MRVGVPDDVLDRVSTRIRAWAAVLLAANATDVGPAPVESVKKFVGAAVDGSLLPSTLYFAVTVDVDPAVVTWQLQFDSGPLGVPIVLAPVPVDAAADTNGPQDVAIRPAIVPPYPLAAAGSTSTCGCSL